MRHTGAYYIKEGFNSRQVIQAARDHLRGIKFDTIVATGVSGMIVAPVLAYSLRKNLLVVRKQNDGSHSGSLLEGFYGKRLLLVDDFMDSGKTVDRVFKQLFFGLSDVKLVGAYMYRALPVDLPNKVDPHKYGRFYPVEFFNGKDFLQESAQAFILRSIG